MCVDLGTLLRTPGSDTEPVFGPSIVPLDVRLFDPAQHSSARQLGSVIRDDHQWLAMQIAKSIEFPDDSGPRQGRVHDARQTLPRKVVDDVEIGWRRAIRDRLDDA